jgi:thiol-disulfide isomerase/thioredoxin
MKPKLAIGMAVAVMASLAVVALSVGWLSGQHQPPAKREQEKMAAPVFSTTAEVAQLSKPEAATMTPAVLYASTFSTVDGKRVSLGQWQDKVLVVNFWATWCGPCKEEMPIFDRLQQKFGANGVQFIGIAADSTAKVANFQKQLPVSYPLLPDEVGAIDFSKRLGNRLGLLPHTVVFAPGGGVVYAKLGVVEEREFSEILQKSIKK